LIVKIELSFIFRSVLNPSVTDLFFLGIELNFGFFLIVFGFNIFIAFWYLLIEKTFVYWSSVEIMFLGVNLVFISVYVFKFRSWFDLRFDKFKYIRGRGL
jgi:hypothetical protein